MMITILKSRFAAVLGAGRYWQGVARSEYWLAKRLLPWSDPSRLHQVRYGLNIGQMPKNYATKRKAKDQSSKVSTKKWKSEIIRLSPTKGLEQPIEMPFTRLDKGTWLHKRPETDVYKILAEAYRLLATEAHFYEGEWMAAMLWGCNLDQPGFQRFLRKAATRRGLLPPWWNREKEAACEQFFVNLPERPKMEYIEEIRTIMDHYGDRLFPLQLRMLAEAVYGTHPCGTDGTVMRELMMREERGELNSRVIEEPGGTKLTCLEFPGRHVVWIWDNPSAMDDMSATDDDDDEWI
ncbi:hypothetical protein CFAM422_013076 [Trichoderma lentiforme]|uniref:Uncharacterized protein n=1 Tax=Trichoderma lentiforme TaxID=1567552 RepID=A0A9P5C5X7_9HYPO|nr:hypothetical protein CFAM422_013076 [Trichoderma lentiforme]